ncbi:uncharacterized protein zgc:113425 isoform X2 [Hemiscyllium ocellatum]|uniref:uncharacterized protein zgc:113425 isoform X2 n=1 Tax=Hemiscyllium ocellatum TaxID=170820 RepID=UPI0029671B68|nr:uncharacterized protein zgc:113425 isoform X2 [Hemiscyllium ocellatum]
MARYRYFIFNQRGMVILGFLQIACAAVCVMSGFMDTIFRKSSALSRTRIPVWTGMAMAIPGVLALFSSQKKNPVLVSSMVASAVFSWITTTILIIYAALTLNYGEDDDEVFQHKPNHVIHMQSLITEDQQPQTIELVCTWQGGGDQRILNDPVGYNDWNIDTEDSERTSKPVPYTQLA